MTSTIPLRAWVKVGYVSVALGALACGVADGRGDPGGETAAPSDRAGPGAVAAASQTTAARPAAGPGSGAPSAVSTEWRKAMSKTPLPKEGCFRASHPNRTWEEIQCKSPPAVPYRPAHGGAVRAAGGAAQTVGNGADSSAAVSGNISWAEGSFPRVTDVTSVTDGTANNFSLQLNSNPFNYQNPSASECRGAQTPASCMGWQQFVYAPGVVFMQYWLLDYGNTCPAGWNTYGSDCWRNSNGGASVPTQPATNLPNMALTGVAGNTDVITMVTGDGNLYAYSQASVLALAQNWKAAEFNVFGDGDATEASFNSGATVVVQVLTDSAPATAAAPICAPEGFTGETNNLNLVNGSCCAIGGAGWNTPGIQFTESTNPNALTQGCPVPESFSATTFEPGGTRGYGTISGSELVATAQGTGGNSSAEVYADVAVPSLASTVASGYATVDVIEANAHTPTNSANVLLTLTMLDATGAQQCTTTESIAGNGASSQTAQGTYTIPCEPLALQPGRGPYRFEVTLTTLASNFWDSADATVVVESATLNAEYQLQTITDQESAKCLETLGADAADESRDGTAADEWECWGGVNQKWQYENDLTLRNVEGMCLDAWDPGNGQPSAGIQDEDPVDIWSCIGGAVNQRWTWIPFQGSTGFWKSGLTGPGGDTMCLTSTTHVDGQQLVIRPCLTSGGQVWIRH